MTFPTTSVVPSHLATYVRLPFTRQVKSFKCVFTLGLLISIKTNPDVIDLWFI